MPLARQLARAEALLERDPDDAGLVEIRELLAAAIQSHDRGELSSAQAEAMAALACQALNAAELLQRAGAGGR
jgi:hypothetical protein